MSSPNCTNQPETITDEESPLLAPAATTPDDGPTAQELPLAKLIAVLLSVWVSPDGPNPIGCWALTVLPRLESSLQP